SAEWRKGGGARAGEPASNGGASRRSQRDGGVDWGEEPSGSKRAQETEPSSPVIGEEEQRGVNAHVKCQPFENCQVFGLCWPVFKRLILPNYELRSKNL